MRVEERKGLGAVGSLEVLALGPECFGPQLLGFGLGTLRSPFLAVEVLNPKASGPTRRDLRYSPQFSELPFRVN